MTQRVPALPGLPSEGRPARRQPASAHREPDGPRPHPLPHVFFRSVVDLRDGSVFAQEASVHDVTVLATRQTMSPLEAEATEPTLPHVDRRSTEIVLARWAELPDARRILINMSADAFVDAMRKDSQGWLMQALAALDIAADRLLIEITGPGRPWDSVVLNDAVKALRAAGGRLSLGDEGAGHASFRSWCELEPDYVRIGKQWITDVAVDPRKRTIVRGICEVAAEFGTQLIAEGIDANADLQVVLSLGIPYGQGEHVVRKAHSRNITSPPAGRARDLEAGADLASVDSGWRRPAALQNFALIQAPVLTWRTTNDEVAAMFQGSPQLHALAVVEDARPVALIPRQQFMDQYARLYFREVHGRKACLDSANPAPCVIERDASIEALASVLTSSDQRYLSEGFIVTEKGRYVGLGTGDQLVRVVTETRLEAARHANPLTFLPGNIPVSLHIDRLLAAGVAFVACHADLDNFKPFNDRYGFARGDEMIRLTARLILSHCDSHRDFVGHLGGDDFVIVFQSVDWQARCEAIIQIFQKEACALLDEDARIAGGFDAQDRHGVRRFFPCTTISMGAVVAAPGIYQRAEEVAMDAATAKHDAKLSPSGIAVCFAGAGDVARVR